MTQYTPIEIDFLMPRKHERKKYGKIRMLLVEIANAFGFYRDFTIVNAINQHLKNRKYFPKDEWGKDFKDVSAIEYILKLASRDTCKINHHFIPSDHLIYVTWCDVGGNVANFMSSDIKDSGIGECSASDIVSMVKDNYTLKEFFLEIISNRKIG